MRSFIFRILSVVFFWGLAAHSFANISLPAIFGDNMVLQQKSEVTLWGWAKTGEPVVVSAGWTNEEVTTKADPQGKWEIVVKTPEAGGPFEIRIKGYNEIVLKNVLIGEVWLCSGQSNMEWSALSGIDNSEEEIENAGYPEIRLFTVLHSTAHWPQNHLAGHWAECLPETMKSFSAVAYFFARKLQKELGVPVGLINSSWGGTPAEAWMPEEATQADSYLKQSSALLKPVPWGPVGPGSIYNAMIAPVIPFRVAGALWYQGEANTINGYAYRATLTALIESWREKWGYDFPFYFAQIAPYRYGKPLEGVIVRDQQRRVLEVPNTGMVVLSDIGDTTDIHPRNKQDVGLRLANMALNRHYKTVKLEDSGPLFSGMVIDKNRAVISFDHAEGLHAKGGEVTCFEIAGKDGKFYPAEAKISSERVVVESKKVKEPAKVRFAWRNTATPNLFNGADLPASCFITD